MTPSTALPVGEEQGPTVPARRLERALGIDDRRGWLLAWWQALLVGAAFVAISLVGYHSPQPRDVPVAVTGTPSQQDQLAAALGATSRGAYLVRAESRADADRELRRGELYAVVDLTGSPTIRYAGAQGPTVFAALVRTVVPSVAATTGRAPALVDTVPLGADDAAALPLFYLSFAVVLASYLFSITTTTQARALSARGHWTSAAALAVSLAVLAGLFARYGTGTLTARTPVVVVVLALTSLATGATSYLLLTLSRSLGAVLGTVVLVVLGSASGGVVPGQFLPAWLAALRPVLPMGLSLGTVRDLTYFGGHHAVRGVAVLLLWAVLPLVLAAGVARHRAGGAGGPQPATSR